MNCLDFRRLKLADPRDLPAEAFQHAQQCASCEAFSRSVDQTEADLIRALQVPIPEGLADRILLAQRREQRSWRFAALALAASIIAGLGLGFHFWRVSEATSQAELAIQHVLDEPVTLAATEPLDRAAFVEAIDRLGGRLSGNPGEITHFSICFVGDRLGWHVVLRTPSGTAALLLMPGKPLYARGEVARSGWNAVSEPVGRGSVVVVADSAHVATGIARMLKEQIQWSG